ERVVYAKFSPDGRWVGTVSGSTAQIWEPTQGQRLSLTPPQSAPLRFLAFSADSRRFVTHTERSSVPALPVFGATTIGLVGSPFGPGPLLAASALIPRGIPGPAIRYANDKPAEIRVWDTATGQPVGPALLQVGKHVPRTALSPDGSRLAMVG